MCLPLHSTKLLLSDRRNRLGDDVIEASEGLKCWIDDGFVFGGMNLDVNRMQNTLNAFELYTVGLSSSSMIWPLHQSQGRGQVEY